MALSRSEKISKHVAKTRYPQGFRGHYQSASICLFVRLSVRPSWGLDKQQPLLYNKCYKFWAVLLNGQNLANIIMNVVYFTWFSLNN